MSALERSEEKCTSVKLLSHGIGLGVLDFSFMIENFGLRVRLGALGARIVTRPHVSGSPSIQTGRRTDVQKAPVTATKNPAPQNLIKMSDTGCSTS